MAEFPRVSILINNYNYDNFLRDSIESALGQTYPNIEVVVVDDGSADNSRSVIAEYGDRIIPVLKQNGGQGSAFNAGFAASSGDIICFLDADDYFSKDKVEKVVARWQTRPDAGWLFHGLEDVDQNGTHLREAAHLDSGYFDFRAAMRTGGSVPALPATTGLCFRRAVLEKTLPMSEKIRISADQFLRLSATFFAPGILMPESVAVHRIHGSNLFEARKDTAVLSADTNLQTCHPQKPSSAESETEDSRLLRMACLPTPWASYWQEKVRVRCSHQKRSGISKSIGP
ncbi:MAG: glycosyltransferase [Cyanobacteria bacterium J06649_4]